MKTIETIIELEDVLIKSMEVSFYGAGKTCDKVLNYLKEKNRIWYVKEIFVTFLPCNLGEKQGIKVKQYCKDIYIGERPLIITVTSDIAKREIIELLENEKIDNYYILGQNLESYLDIALKNINRYKKAKHKIQTYISNSNERTENQDICFFSLPYWDVYSPFSAVPCLVARLQQDGYKVAQVDLGILCIHWMIQNRWKEAASICITSEFYEQNIKNYKENKYDSYEKFFEDMWFFKNDSFDVNQVKKKYLDMNPVQKRIVDAFYKHLCELETSGFNFDQCSNLSYDVENYAQSNFLDEITSEKIISAFQNLPPIIGLSVISTEQFLPACMFAKILKEILPDTTIIMGGSCVELFVKSQYKTKKDIYQYFDYIIAGEGETSISMLMDYLKNKETDYSKIPNLLHIDSQGDPIVSKQIIEDVNTLPVPNYDGLNLELYLSPEIILPYQSSRGCHYGYCAFCNHDEKYRHNYRCKNMEKVVDELIYLSNRYNVKNFQFVDEAIRPDCFRDLIDEMDKHDEFQHINWFFYSRVSRQYDKELLTKAVRNGCKMVMFGVESLNQRLLKFIRKGINAEVSRECLKLFHSVGIKTYIWLMCNIPSETVEEAKEDLKSVQEIENYIDALSVSQFYLSKNTDMYKNPEKFNIIYVDNKNSYKFISHHEGKIINKEEMSRFYREQYLKYQKYLCSVGNRYTLFWTS